MAKSKLVTPDGISIASSGSIVGAEKSTTPKVKGVRPCGSQVLVELLTQQEMMGTNISISDKVDLKIPRQGYVRSVGPGFKSEDFGFKVGDRVLISGGGVLAPDYDGCHRERFFMEPHAIKSVLEEA